MLSLVCTCPVQAQDLFSGIEWGINPTFYTHHDYQYTTLGGYHMDEHYFDNQLATSGYLAARAGFRFGSRYSLALTSGYMGVQAGIRIIPLGLYGSINLGERPENVGFLVYAEGGTGWSTDDWKHTAEYARSGLGYRIALGGGMLLKFQTGLQMSIAHPLPYDTYDERFVDPDHLEYSVRTALALNFGMALEF